MLVFQSTLPVRGETEIAKFKAEKKLISIHSPRAGRDFLCLTDLYGNTDFNPLSPCGERQQKCTILCLHFCENLRFSRKNTPK